jgi:uncharacterized low-complexity protein
MRIPALLCALVVGIALLAAAAAAGAAESTTVTVFHAFTAAGKPALPTRSATGYCWTGSLAADRSDAWRCFIGNEIHDPCFSSARTPGVVVCPNVMLSSAIEIRLTRPLPVKLADRGTASAKSQPWLIELDSAPTARCEFATGATSAIGELRLNYLCTGGGLTSMGLWGLPLRSKPQWHIRIAPFSAKSLAHASDPGIRHVWM